MRDTLVMNLTLYSWYTNGVWCFVWHWHHRKDDKVQLPLILSNSQTITFGLIFDSTCLREVLLRRGKKTQVICPYVVEAPNP